MLHNALEVAPGRKVDSPSVVTSQHQATNATSAPVTPVPDVRLTIGAVTSHLRRILKLDNSYLSLLATEHTC